MAISGTADDVCDDGASSPSVGASANDTGDTFSAGAADVGARTDNMNAESAKTSSESFKKFTKISILPGES